MCFSNYWKKALKHKMTTFSWYKVVFYLERDFTYLLTTLVDMKPISSMFPKAVISLTGSVKNAYQFWLPSPLPYFQNLPSLEPPPFSNLEEDSCLIKTSPKYVRSVKVGCGRDVYLGNRVGRVNQRRAWHETLLHFCKNVLEKESAVVTI